MAFLPLVEICVIGALSVLAFAGGIHVSRRFDRVRPFLFAGSLLVALVYAWAFSGKLGWASVLPFATVVIWANLMPVLLSLAAGMALHSPRLSPWRRKITIGLLTGLAIAFTLTPMLRPKMAPLHVDSMGRWNGQICLQSHPASCAPAAAATLLRLSGIETTEKTLAVACYTSRHGTEPLGLFRGLSSTARQHAISPAIASTDPQQWSRLGQLPNIALVQFERIGPQRPLDRLLGPREGHAVVVLEHCPDGDWLIADPAFGKTTWSDEQFRKRFTGNAIFLAP